MVKRLYNSGLTRRVRAKKQGDGPDVHPNRLPDALEVFNGGSGDCHSILLPKKAGSIFVLTNNVLLSRLNSVNYPHGFDLGRGVASAAPAFFGFAGCEHPYILTALISIVAP